MPGKAWCHTELAKVYAAAIIGYGTQVSYTHRATGRVTGESREEDRQRYRHRREEENVLSGCHAQQQAHVMGTNKNAHTYMVGE